MVKQGLTAQTVEGKWVNVTVEVPREIDETLRICGDGAGMHGWFQIGSFKLVGVRWVGDTLSSAESRGSSSSLRMRGLVTRKRRMCVEVFVTRKHG